MKRELKNLLGLAIVFVLIVSINASPAPGENVDIGKLTKKVYPSVVKVEARNGMRKVATGVVIDKEGHIVTTALISPQNADVFIVTGKGERIDAEFLGLDSVTHLAVIKAKGKKWNPIEWGSSEDLDPGSWIGVVSISPEDTAAVTQGIVSSIGPDSLRLNVWVVPGASGSPVINKEGRMVGMVRGAYGDRFVYEFQGRVVAGSSLYFSQEEAPSSALAMGIPVDIVKKVSSEIKETGKVQRGWLGVSIFENEDGTIEVVEVEKDSPASEGGLEVNDIIITFDGDDISTTTVLVNKIRMKKPGDKATIVIDRDGKKQEIKVELGENSQRSIIQEFEAKFPRLFPSEKNRGLELRKFFPEDSESDLFNWIRGSSKHIGVFLQELTPELGEYFGVKDGAGLLVTKVSADSPSAKAGVKVGDVIIKANGKAVKSNNRLRLMIQKMKKGDQVELELVRDKKKLSLKVDVAEEDADFNFSSSRFVAPANWDNQYKKAEALYDKANKLNYQNFQEQLKENRNQFESQQKKAQEIYKSALKRYRCIKV